MKKRNLNDTQYRDFDVSNRDIDEERRTIELAFSSENPVFRWYGIEILDHSKGSVRLGRMENGGDVLVDHDAADHVGVVESVSIDSDKIGRATVRLGRSARADEIFNDVIDGIRSKISVGYRVYKEERTEIEGGADEYLATDWEPIEISFVSIPADDRVGVGRSANIKGGKMQNKTEKSPEKQTESVDISAIQSKARCDEQGRVREILKTGSAYSNDTLARQFVESGGTIDEFRAALLESIGKTEPTRAVADSAEIGLTAKEAAGFSFLRAINAMANPTDRRAQESAKFEFEASAAAAERSGKEPQGILVPFDVLTRDLSAGVPTAGGNLIQTDVLGGSFIDLLRNKAVILGDGMATVLSGLNGNVAIPRQTGGATAFWVAENGTPTQSDAAFDQVQLTPRTVGALTGLSRRLIAQSSIDVESMVRMDLASQMALAIDYAALFGDGTGGSPIGVANTTGIGAVIGGANGAAPTFAHVVALDSAVESQNVTGTSYIINAATKGKLATTEKAANTAQFIYDNGAMYGHAVAVTNQAPSNLTKGAGTNLSAMLYGNWSDLIVGMWGGLDLFTQPTSSAGRVEVNALQDVDIAVRHPESFAAMMDVITA